MVSTPLRTWKLTRSKADGWQWDVLVDGKVVGRMKQTKVNGRVEWAGMTLVLPGPEFHKYRRTRDELGRLRAELGA